MQCIYDLKDEGLSIDDIMLEEGEDAKNNIPDQYVSKQSGNLVTEELIADIIKNKVADNKFLRKVVLVLLGTVLAPESHLVIPKLYYAIVQDVERLKKLNFNDFSLSFLLNSLKQVRTGTEMRQWPKGNLSLLQVLLLLLICNIIRCRNF